MRKRDSEETSKRTVIGKGQLLTPEPKVPLPASSLQERATDDLRYIRSTMERAGSFTSVSGMGMMLVGCIGCAAWWWGRGLHFEFDAASLLAIWLSSAFAAVVVSGWAIRRKAVETRQSLSSGPARTFVIAFVPSLLAGVVLTAFFFQREQTAWLPGTWLTLYGAAVAAGGATSVKPVPIMGAIFMLLGVAAFMSPGRAQLLLLAGFGGLHLLFGFLIKQRYGG